MMEAPYPTAFWNPLRKWVRTTCSGSLFNVMVESRGQAEIIHIRTKVRQLQVVPEEKREERCTQTNYSTGFAVEQRDGVTRILTAAHCVEHMYAAGHPITAQRVRDLFSIKILCEHHEEGFQASRMVDKVRYYNIARVVEIDCNKGLLLLEIDTRSILQFVGSSCDHAHQPLLPRRNPANALETVVMVSWPPSRPRTSATGEISHCGRDYGDESDTNPHGYDMTLVGVKIPGHEGSSGAPMLDGHGHYLVMFHGAGKECFSCFVSLRDILRFLRRCGVICNPA